MNVFVATTRAKSFVHEYAIGSLPPVTLSNFVSTSREEFRLGGTDATVLGLPRSQFAEKDPRIRLIHDWSKLPIQFFDDSKVENGTKTIILDDQNL